MITLMGINTIRANLSRKETNFFETFSIEHPGHFYMGVILPGRSHSGENITKVRIDTVEPLKYKHQKVTTECQYYVEVEIQYGS